MLYGRAEFFNSHPASLPAATGHTLSKSGTKLHLPFCAAGLPGAGRTSEPLNRTTTEARRHGGTEARRHGGTEARRDAGRGEEGPRTCLCTPVVMTAPRSREDVSRRKGAGPNWGLLVDHQASISWDRLRSCPALREFFPAVARLRRPALQPPPTAGQSVWLSRDAN